MQDTKDSGSLLERLALWLLIITELSPFDDHRRDAEARRARRRHRGRRGRP